MANRFPRAGVERQNHDRLREGCLHAAATAVAVEAGTVIVDRCGAVLAVHVLAVALATGPLLRILVFVCRPGVALFTDPVMRPMPCSGAGWRRGSWRRHPAS